MLFMIVLFVLSAVFLFKLCKKNLPNQLPGPMALPIIGHLHLIGQKSLHILLRDMSYIYGDVFRLKLGSQNAVILSSRKAIKEAFVKQAKTFASRPNLPTFEHTRNGQVGISLCGYSDDYKSNNRMMVAAIHNFLASEDNLNGILRGEANKFIRLFDKYAESRKPVEPFTEFRKIIPSVSLSLMFKQSFEYDDPSFLAIADQYHKWFVSAEADNPADFFPFMLNFPNSRLDDCKRCGHEFEKFSMMMIDKCESVSQADDFDESNASFFDCLLMQYTNRNKTPLTRPEKQRLAKILSDLTGGGFDTSASVLSWAMLHLAKQPEILQRCRDEINDNLSGCEELSIGSRHNLPYFSATIYDLFRLTTVAPLGLTHQVTKDTVLLGYNVPKDTMVLANLWQVNHDPERWEEPEKLYPGHFLNENNELDPLMIRESMTFSSGIRQCPGKMLAFHMVFMTLGNIIKDYDISISKEPEDLIPQRGLTLKPKHYTMTLSRLNNNNDDRVLKLAA